MQPPTDPAPGPSGPPPLGAYRSPGAFYPGVQIQPIVNWNKRLVLDRYGPALPAERCFKCNAPSSCRKRKQLAWSHPALILLIFLGILIYVIVALIVQKRVTIEFGLCEQCRRNRRTRLWIATLLMFGSLGLCVFGAIDENWALFGWALLGFFVFLISLAFLPRIGYPTRIDDRWIHLAGAGRAYRESFPQAAYDPR